MGSVKYVGLDVHQATTSAAVLDQDGKLVMQAVLAARADAVMGFLAGLGGTLQSPSKKAPTPRGSTICRFGVWLG